MSRRVKVAGLIVVVLGAAAAVVTNYATAEVPEFFRDQWRVWLVLAVLVLLVVVVTLLQGRGDEQEPVVPKLSVLAPASLRPPAGSVEVLRGRETELARVMELVRSPGGRFAVVSGAGGMGKTTLARIAAEQAQQRGVAVFWIRRRDEESLAAQMVEVGLTLGLAGGAVVAAQQSGASVADVVWRHLETVERWLLVLDNVDQPDALGAGDPVASYRGWVRPGGGGLLLVTSRDRATETWGRNAEQIELRALTPQEGGQALLDLAPGAGTPEDAEKLSARLGGFPLALHAAGTALASPTARSRTFTAYQQALLDKSAQVLPEHPDITDRDTARTLIGHTWEVSLDQLADEGHPLARPLLRALALLAEAPIPLPLITPALIHGTTDDAAGRAAVDAALAQLHRYGLLDDHETSDTATLPTVALHPLVRETNTLLLERHREIAQWRATAETAVLDLADAWAPKGRPSWTLLHLLTPHLLVLCTLETKGDLAAFTATRDTLDAAARQLRASGDAATELALRYHVFNAEKTALGAEHPDTLSSQSNLAIALGSVGRYGEAVELHRGTLDIRTRVLGAEHPDTVRSKNNLVAV
ncbi:tetratricopeptide repeat protein [Actinokineospora auranticolor]|uniref:Mrp family chromosome partitioning ATPase n=1 Tax=Actinokineospora auranticolor TaxID=155976 RepID=A0A2S6H1A3_9PSEU|nr:tetratricopeptide repeat protein [Actinokineospora auranticolor]PPK71268.1 Mrp family chromosome partitioning ATPase [Actinokineospora auranticolor]